MQRLDEAKRLKILEVAGDLFARRAFHEVKLDDIASAARVGKGTVYVYFDSKESLYFHMIAEKFDRLLEELREIADADQADARQVITRIVHRLAKWTLENPQMFELMRAGIDPAGTQALRRRRKSLGELIHRVLLDAVEKGQIVDPNPALTAQFIPAMARSGAVWGSRNLSADTLAGHMMLMLAPRFRKACR